MKELFLSREINLHHKKNPFNFMLLILFVLNAWLEMWDKSNNPVMMNVTVFKNERLGKAQKLSYILFTIHNVISLK